ncbi:MAG: hypothetical protein GXY55_11585 [Phycisphaerae bacterium]|nr:hypothetical protein [Phycisphaerae bacterium]
MALLCSRTVAPAETAEAREQDTARIGERADFVTNPEPSTRRSAPAIAAAGSAQAVTHADAQAGRIAERLLWSFALGLLTAALALPLACLIHWLLTERPLLPLYPVVELNYATITLAVCITGLGYLASLCGLWSRRPRRRAVRVSLCLTAAAMLAAHVSSLAIIANMKGRTDVLIDGVWCLAAGLSLLAWLKACRARPRV